MLTHCLQCWLSRPAQPSKKTWKTGPAFDRLVKMLFFRISNWELFSLWSQSWKGYNLPHGANVRAKLGGRMTPVSLFLSTAGVSLTLMSLDRLGAHPALQPASCLIACHLGHDWSNGATGWTTAQHRQILLSAPRRAHGIAQDWTNLATRGEQLHNKTAKTTLRRTERDCLQVLRWCPVDCTSGWLRGCHCILRSGW